jgi:hypothetical protein
MLINMDDDHPNSVEPVRGGVSHSMSSIFPIPLHRIIVREANAHRNVPATRARAQFRGNIDHSSHFD